MQARMTHPAMIVARRDAGVAGRRQVGRTRPACREQLIELVHLRASQINGCSVCVEMHVARA